MPSRVSRLIAADSHYAAFLLSYFLCAHFRRRRLLPPRRFTAQRQFFRHAAKSGAHMLQFARQGRYRSPPFSDVAATLRFEVFLSRRAAFASDYFSRVILAAEVLVLRRCFHFAFPLPLLR